MKLLHCGRRLMPALLASVFVVFLAGGCALIPEEVASSEPSAYLEYSPQIYARLSGQALRDITKGMSDKELSELLSSLVESPKTGGLQTGQASSSSESTIDGSFIKDFLDKTNAFGAGIRDVGTDQPKAEAIFLGRFSPVSLRLGLTMEGNWRRMDDGGYRSAQYPLFLRSPQFGWIHLTTESGPPPKTEAIQAYPLQMKDIASSDVFISINEPRLLYAGALPLEASAIPLQTVILSGSMESPIALQDPVSGQETAASAEVARNYRFDLSIQVKDEATARAFRPVVRFLWAAAATRVFGSRSDITALPMNLEGSVYVVRGIRLSSSEIRDILKANKRSQELSP